jgi:hypothetical protein
MNKLLPFALVLIASVAAYAQDSNPQVKTVLVREAEYQAHQRRHDSMQVVIAKRRKEIEAYNRAHPIKKPATISAKSRH